MNVLEQFGSEITRLDLWKKPAIVRKNEVLAQKGSNSSEIFLIKSGTAVLSTEIEEKEQIFRFVYRNSLITPVDSFLNNYPTVYELRTIRETKFLTADRAKLETVSEKIQTSLHIYQLS